MDDRTSSWWAAGVSGLSYAFRAAKAGRKVLVIEREAARVGGCLHSHRLADGYWFELGAHTTYNSYGGFWRWPGDGARGEDPRAGPCARPVRVRSGRRSGSGSPLPGSSPS